MNAPFYSSLFKRDTPEITPKHARVSEVGWAESQLYSSRIPKYNPDELMGRKGVKIYQKMMVDEQVKAVVRFKRDAITSRDFQFAIPNAETNNLSEEEENRRVELYEFMVRNMLGSFVDGMNYILTAMYNGFSMTEKLIDTFDFQGKPYLGIRELILRPFETFEFDVDIHGSINKTTQTISGREQRIDLDRFVYYVQNPEYDRHYGRSDLREAYRSWYSKDVIIRFYNQFLERFAGGFMVAKPTEGQLAVGSPDYNAVLAAMDSVKVSTSLLLPSNIDMEVNQPSTTDQFEKAIQMHDLQIAKALLVPNLLGITPQASQQGGGFAQANTQLEAFLWTLDADATRLEEELNEQIFIPLSKLNFADGQGPLLTFKPISENKKLELIKVWSAMVTAGAVEASESDEHHLREMIDFPHKGKPLELEPKIGEPPITPPGTKQREPVKDTNVKSRVVKNSIHFDRAEARVAFSIIERQADKIETDSVNAIESKLAVMVADLVKRVKKDKLGTVTVKGIDKIDFNSRLKAKTKKTIDDMLNRSWALGIKHSSKEILIAKKEQPKLNMGRIDEEAAEFLRLNGFRMFGLLSDDMQAIVHQVLVNGVKFSWTTDVIVEKIYDGLTQKGFVSAAVNASATGRGLQDLLETLDIKGNLGRLKTAVRTNVFEAINEARFSTFTDPDLADFVVALEYSAILDSRTTEICRHLDDRVYPTDAPEWNKWRPPNHFNCRSILVPVTVIDTEVEGKDNKKNSRFSKVPNVDPQEGFGD